MTTGPLSRVAPPSAGEAVVEPRYEVMPFGSAEAQAAALPRPLRLTVTTSPKHGVDHSLDFATRLREQGHQVTLHVAARMVRGEQHAHELLERAHDAGIDDLFVIGGDAPEPLGPYTAAGPLLELVAAHPLRPARLGIGGYPEGHPLIAPDVLAAVLEEKARLADYVVTQLCFDVDALLRWVDGIRARGIELPVFVGAPGAVERRRLVEISMRIGVGPSLRFVRKQHGLTRLFRSPLHAATRLHDQVSRHVGRPERNIAGFHFFTFNELAATHAWHTAR